MGLLSWLTGNSQSKKNNSKIAMVKKELQFMTMRQKIDRLRKMKKNGYYPSRRALDIGDIYDCDFDLASDFLIYYFLFTDDNVRDEVEMEASEPEVAQVEEVIVEAVAEPMVESIPEPVVESSYDSGSSCDSGSCDSGGDCGGCD